MVTNSVPIAAPALRRPGVDLHVLGGRVRGITQTAVGESHRRARWPTCGSTSSSSAPTGSARRHGFSTPDETEAATKRAMVRAAQRVVVLADSSKLGREHLVRFAGVDDVDVLVTDDEADPDVVAEIESHGIEVLIA